MTAPTHSGSQKTGQQLREEILTAANDGIAASGLLDGWALVGGGTWDPETEEFIGSGCTTTESGEHKRQRFEVGLDHPHVGDPMVFVNTMSDRWKDQGYTVNPIGTPFIGADGDIYIDYRADRPDGSLAAGVVANRSKFILHFYTECSTDPTLNDFAGPTGYRTLDPLEQDVYSPTNSPTITPYPDR
ncbi:hypothetical protein ACRAWC_03675 [Leifsonia sp. L25]|uniref:hypothetical protein n=1 Tax=Actinomycetes TaxID=1760 RepID=UPI003D68FC88